MIIARAARVRNKANALSLYIKETVMDEYIGKIVNIVVDQGEYRLSGKLSNHKPNLYQVTGDKEHIVFWDDEVLALHLEKSNNTLTIFI